MANRPAPALALREGDRDELVRLTRAWWCGRVDGGVVGSGRAGAAGADRAAGRGRGVEHGDRGSGGRVASDGDRLAGPLRRAWDRRVGRRAAVWAAADDRSSGGGVGDVEEAAEEVRRDALVEPAAGQA